MKNKFQVMPERKKPKEIHVVEVCHCGHADYNHESKVEKLPAKDKQGIAEFQVVHYKCKDCVCQKYKFVQKMSSENYYYFKKRLFLRTEKLEERIDSIERQLEIVPMVVPEFFNSLEPKKEPIISISFLTKTKCYLKRNFAI